MKQKQGSCGGTPKKDGSGRGANPWMLHLNKVRMMKQNKGKSLSEMMTLAKKTYTPVKKK